MIQEPNQNLKFVDISAFDYSYPLLQAHPHQLEHRLCAMRPCPTERAAVGANCLDHIYDPISRNLYWTYNA